MTIHYVALIARVEVKIIDVAGAFVEAENCVHRMNNAVHCALRAQVRNIYWSKTWGDLMNRTIWVAKYFKAINTEVNHPGSLLKTNAPNLNCRYFANGKSI